MVLEVRIDISSFPIFHFSGFYGYIVYFEEPKLTNVSPIKTQMWQLILLKVNYFLHDFHENYKQ